MEGYNPAVGESNYFARIRDAWRETGITKRMIQRCSEIWVPRAAIWIRVSSVVSIKPGFYRIAAHVPHNFSIRRTPGQPRSGPQHPGANLSLTHQRLVSRRQTLINVWMLRNPRFSRAAMRQ